MPDPAVRLAAELKHEAARLGLDLVGIVKAEDMDQYAGIEVKYWQVRKSTGRPADAMPEVRSIVALGLHIWDPALDVAAYDPNRARWVYPIYSLMQQRRERLALWLVERGFKAPTAPANISLKRLAVLAGFGGYGKNTLVISERYGSDFRMTCLLTDAPLEPDRPATADPCGNCTLCLAACPMGALQPHKVDHEACLVGLSLRERAGDLNEVESDIRRRLATLDRAAFEPRFGQSVHLMCRTCQDVCPHNRRDVRSSPEA